MNGPKSKRTSGPGTLRGRHYTTHVDEVRALYRKGQTDDAAVETLLLELVDAVEAEACVDGLGVAPWYYEQLANVYRRCKDSAAERAILERFSTQPHAPGVKPSKLLERLARRAEALARDGPGTIPSGGLRAARQCPAWAARTG